MDDNPYDFDRFIDEMSEKDYAQILRDGDREATSIERGLSGVRGAPKHRKMGGGTYVARIGQFLFFMRYAIKPDGVLEEDFQKYRKVVAALVKKGQMKPEALKIFESRR